MEICWDPKHGWPLEEMHLQCCRETGGSHPIAMYVCDTRTHERRTFTSLSFKTCTLKTVTSLAHTCKYLLV